MIDNMKVKVGPQVYRYDEGAIDFIPEMLAEYKAKNILIVHGTISWEKAQKYFKFLDDERYNMFYHQYTGECSYYGAGLIKDIVEREAIDFIIGVGGGKLTDLVGYSGHVTNTPYGVVPTLASNCAPWTPLSVMYKESGESEGKSEHYLRQAAFLLTCPSLVIDSPVRYFVAGIADTLAKWYESDLILNQDELSDVPFLQLAKFTTELCKNVILKDSDKAIEDMKQGVVSEEFKNVSEIIFAVSGLVGGLGDKYARNAAAHAVHDGLGKYLSEKSHKYIHGEIVAYGIFYQLALEERWELIDELLPLYERLGLPTSLKSMDIYPISDEDLDNLVDFIDSKEKVHLIPIEINKDVLREAIVKLEEYMENR
ncbi:iron-containing alcohol dehydrogenase family protein [Fundicoccus culcitae]|uniref:Iron-containing alcohol dehydrogenase family protein n=1 Tax=Fundicoccus culcitae TaxID=2969821 RepID=A0ABY5P4J7_9LACT|nr:iron-containing alcohol dehydrogenase family protein [Fundicoccus culcitae]UUX33410.1 iron-containing alcohol dehydrogenase family protein [Fundicoccus culcitae]